MLWQVFTIVTIRPVYSKFVLPSWKSLEIIINIKKKKIIKNKREQNWGCLLIRVCSLIRSNTEPQRTYRNDRSPKPHLVTSVSDSQTSVSDSRFWCPKTKTNYSSFGRPKYVQMRSASIDLLGDFLYRFTFSINCLHLMIICFFTYFNITRKFITLIVRGYNHIGWLSATNYI